MRKTSAALAALSLVVLALTGCSSVATSDSASCERTTHASGIEDAVTVKGDLGVEPDVTVYSPVKNEKTSYADLITGDGRAVVSDQQIMTVELSIFSGDTGKRVYATSYDANQASLTNIDSWVARSPGLGKVFRCVTGGSRVVASLNAEDFGAENLAGIGMDPDDRAVFVIDVLDVYPSKAEGTPQFNDARGLPTVVRAPDGTPGIIVPDAPAPTSQVVQTLIQGTGEPVGKTQTPIVNFTAVKWDDKTVLTSTWGANPAVDLATSAPTVAKALVGKPVGSQILVVTPASDGASAVAFVVDILGAVDTPAQ